MPRIEVLVIAACLGAIGAGVLLFCVGLAIDPARAAKRALKRS